MTDRNQQILMLIDRLSSSARQARALSLDDTSHLLAMALLDLQTKLHAISHDELRSFTRTVANVVDFKMRAPATDTTHVETAENVQNGHMPFLG
jgi:hypothetical protein